MTEDQFERHCRNIRDSLSAIDSSDVLITHASRGGYSMADIELQGCVFQIEDIHTHIAKLRGLIANVRNGGV